jgi:type II secretory pathway pseudopilin PulG
VIPREPRYELRDEPENLLRERGGDPATPLRCARCGAEQEADGSAEDGACHACGAPAVPPATGRGNDREESATSYLYRQARREIASILRRMQEDEVAQAAESGKKSRRRLSPRVAVVLLFALAAAGWVAVRWVNQVVLHHRMARDANRIAQRIESYRSKNNIYPDAATWQRWVTGDDAAGFLDPWQQPYLYAVDSRAFSITTQGADERPGGSGKDADVTFVFPYVNTRIVLPQAQPMGQPASR